MKGVVQIRAQTGNTLNQVGLLLGPVAARLGNDLVEIRDELDNLTGKGALSSWDLCNISSYSSSTRDRGYLRPVNARGQ